MRALPIIWERTRSSRRPRWEGEIGGGQNHEIEAAAELGVCRRGQPRQPAPFRAQKRRIIQYACTMRVELIGHFKPCMTEIYLYIDARMADYIRLHTHP